MTMLPDVSPSPSPSRFRAWLLAASIFALGLAVGAAGLGLVGYVVVRRSIQSALTGPGLVERAADRIGTDLKRNLSLTTEEAARVQAILDQSASRFKTLRRRVALQAAAELRSATEEISSTLPPEKRAAFETLVRQRLDRLGLPGRNPR